MLLRLPTVNNVVVLVVASLTALASCASQTISAARPSGVQTATASPSRIAHRARHVTPDRAPRYVRGEPERGSPDAQQPRGTVVPASAVAVRADTGSELVGLADCGPFLGSSYPVASRNGGRSWAVIGPEFWRAAAQGARGVLYITASRSVIVAWGSSVVTSPDLGRHWWRTYLLADIRTARVTGDTIWALAPGGRAPGHPGETTAWWYRSTDGGQTWRYIRPGRPAPPRTVGPHGETRPVCG